MNKIINSLLIILIILLLPFGNINSQQEDILQASGRGHVTRVKELIQSGIDVNLKSSNGVTPLIAASHYGHLSIVRMLISAGAEVNARDKKGNSALISASMQGRIEIVKLLLQNGADVYASVLGKNSINFAEYQGHREVADLLRSHINSTESDSIINTEENIPVNIKNHFSSHCSNAWTKRGILDERMYNYCLDKEKQRYLDLLFLLEQHQRFEWLNVVKEKIIHKWTKRSVTHWSQVHYAVNREIEAYLNIEYGKNHNQYSVNQYNKCFNQWKNTEYVWTQTEFCLKKGGDQRN